MPLCTLAVPSGCSVTALDQHQREGLVQAVRQDLDAQGGAQLLRDLGDGVLPALVGRAAVRRRLRCEGGWVAVELGDEGGEWLAGAGVCDRFAIEISPLWRVSEGRAARLFRSVAACLCFLPSEDQATLRCAPADPRIAAPGP